METHVFSSATDAARFLQAETSLPKSRLPSATLMLPSLAVLIAILVAASIGGHRSVSLLARLFPGLPINVPQ